MDRFLHPNKIAWKIIKALIVFSTLLTIAPNRPAQSPKTATILVLKKRLGRNGGVFGFPKNEDLFHQG